MILTCLTCGLLKTWQVQSLVYCETRKAQPAKPKMKKTEYSSYCYNMLHYLFITVWCLQLFLNLQRRAIGNRPRLLCMFVFLLPCVVHFLSLWWIKITIIITIIYSNISLSAKYHTSKWKTQWRRRTNTFLLLHLFNGFTSCLQVCVHHCILLGLLFALRLENTHNVLTLNWPHQLTRQWMAWLHTHQHYQSHWLPNTEWAWAMKGKTLRKGRL